MDDMRSVLTMSDKQMPEWIEICKEFARHYDAQIIYVNKYSCGLQYNDGSLRRITVRDMINILKGRELCS